MSTDSPPPLYEAVLLGFAPLAFRVRGFERVEGPHGGYSVAQEWHVEEGSIVPAIRDNAQVDAKQKATDALLAKLRQDLSLELVEGLPSPVYGFNPDGWMLFRVDGLP